MGKKGRSKLSVRVVVASCYDAEERRGRREVSRVRYRSEASRTYLRYLYTANSTSSQLPTQPYKMDPSFLSIIFFCKPSSTSSQGPLRAVNHPLPIPATIAPLLVSFSRCRSERGKRPHATQFVRPVLTLLSKRASLTNSPSLRNLITAMR